MKRFLPLLLVLSVSAYCASAQVLPTFQFGIKGGVNLSSISSSASSTFSSSNQSGYLGGLWARFGAVGFNFQPEIYFTSKNVDVITNGGETKAKFTSVDVPFLFGGKVGALGIGGRFYTGPMVSLAINKQQSFGGAVDHAITFDYHDQNFAWQFGAGMDIKAISIDLRYEAGITKQSYNGTATHLNMFNLTLAYRLFKL